MQLKHTELYLTQLADEVIKYPHITLLVYLCVILSDSR